ncbi:hypothetical protein VTK26DRAFT_7778 [Humicola hyalothermophila]
MFPRAQPVDDAVANTREAAAANDSEVITAHRRPPDPILTPAANKLATTSGSPQEQALTEDDIVRDSWVSVASTAASRNSAAPSIFSVRASTASAATRYSARLSSIESPILATGPLFQDHPKTDGPRYCCTFCGATFDTKTEWKLHELDFHDRPERYVCPNCPAAFARVGLLAEHRNAAHGFETPARAADSILYATIRSAWGCGFCAAFITSRTDFLEHVGAHYDEGKTKSEWQHTRVIEGLLRQPKLEAAWMALVNNEEDARGAKLRFFWDPATTGRSIDESEPRSLQDILEFFSTGTRKPEEVAAAAYSSAQVRLEGNVGGLVRRLFRRHSQAQLPTSTSSAWALQATSAGGDDEPISPTSPLPPPFRPAENLQHASASISEPSSSHPASHAHSWDEAQRADDPMPQTVELVGPNVASSPSTTFASQPRNLEGSTVPRPLKPTTIRRIDSSRSLVLNQPTRVRNNEVSRPGTPLSLRNLQVPPISGHCSVTARDHNSIQPVSEMSGRSFGSNETGNCSAIAKTRSQTSVRPHASSSTLSTRTGDSSQAFDDSICENMSDDSLSEPDTWLEFDGIAAASDNWKWSFQRAIDQGMGRLWARYNRDWDALVRQCTGGRQNDASRLHEWSDRASEGSSSRQAPGKGLRPNGRSFAKDGEDDDEDEGYRPGSSLSKRGTGSTKRFACPFRKHDPQTYNIVDYEVCAIRSWSTISRLKEHLYRRHYKIHCARCKQTFNDARELSNHELSLTSCEIVDTAHPGDITSYQEKQLKSRKHTARRQSDTEKWADIYRLLFPSEESVPSPYPEPAEDIVPGLSESHGSLGFQHFLLTEMPRLFTRTAEEHAGRQLQSHEALPMAAIPKIIEESLQKAFRTWEARGSEVPHGEASIASMNLLPEVVPTTLSYTLNEPSTGFQTSMLSAGMNHGFSHQSLGSSSAAFTPDLGHTAHADDSGFVDANFYASEPPVDFNTLAPTTNGGWEAGLGLTGTNTFESHMVMGHNFRGFRNGY